MAEKIKSTIECLIEVYNAQIMHLTTSRVDKEFFQALVIADPNNKDHYANKAKADTLYKDKVRVIGIINMQIKEELKRLKKEKKKDVKKN